MIRASCNLSGISALYLWRHNFQTRKKKKKTRRNFICNLSAGGTHRIRIEKQKRNSVLSAGTSRQRNTDHSRGELMKWLWNKQRGCCPRSLSRTDLQQVQSRSIHRFLLLCPPDNPSPGSSLALISSYSHRRACQPTSLSPGSLPHWFPAHRITGW